MKHYINKDTVVKEITRRIFVCKSVLWDKDSKYHDRYRERCVALENLLEFLNTLDVKKVDIDREIEEEYLKRRCYGGRDNMLVLLNELQFNKIAKHFFELGLKAKKGE